MQRSILVTGWACPAAALEPLARALDPVPLLFDFHTRPAPDETTGLSGYAAGVIRCIREELAVPVRLIGWSTGALIALEVAASQPECVRDLVLIGGTARFTATPDYPAGCPVEQVDQLAAAVASDTARERALTRFMAQAALPQRLDRATLIQRVRAAGSLGVEGLLTGLDYLRTTDLRAVVAGIRCPVRIWQGAADAVIPVAAAAWLADQMPQAQVHIEPAAGHDWPLQNPHAVAEWIRG